MSAKIKEEIELLKELINNSDTPSEEKELYRETIAELEKELGEAKPEPKSKPEPKKPEPKPKSTPKKLEPKAKAPAKPKPLPVDAEKMKAEIKDRTGKTEEECEQIIAEYRKLREKAKRVKAKRLEKLDSEGKLIDGTNVKNAAAVIESTAKDVKDKIERQVAQIEKEADKGNRTPEQIEARINRNLDKLSKEMTKQATTFIKGIQTELAKADKTEAKQFLLNVREEIDELLNKFAGGGWLRDRNHVNKSEDYEVRYHKNHPSSRKGYQKKKFSGGGSVNLNTEVILTENREGGSVVRAVVSPFMLESIEENQFRGGFKRYEIDIYDEVDREPTLTEIEELNNFFDKIGGRFNSGGLVQTYNITQSNMGASSVNPSLFEGGGSVPSFKKRFSDEEFQYRLNLAKSQIISDIKNGVVDASKIEEFRDLHDFVDANYYGGFVEYDYEHSKEFRFENKVQDALNKWIVSGGLKEALDNPSLFAVGGSIESDIANADARIANLRELRAISSPEQQERLDNQIASIEREKQRMLMGDAAPRKKLFGLF